MANKNISALQSISEMIQGTGKDVDKTIPAISVVDYNKKFKKFIATKDVNFDVGHGVIHGFIGPNGAGKTTTIKALIGAYVPTSGKVLINGHKSGTKHANELIGYIPEKAAFPKHLNTISYLVSMGRISGLNARDAKERATSILEALGLEAHAKRKPIGFSSGMQKKILLAQSLLTDPKILILDEPAANLDPTARKELFDQLIMLRNQGKTILISSHILAELERLIDEVTFIYYGAIVYSGKVSKLLKDDSDVYIKSSDNEKLAAFLKKKKYKVIGDLKTEIEIPKVKRKDVEKLFKLLPASKVEIQSFRSNDLQAIYDHLLAKSEKENAGSQMVGDVKAIAMKKSDKEATKENVVEETKEAVKKITKIQVAKKSTTPKKPAVKKTVVKKSTTKKPATKKVAANKNTVTKKPTAKKVVTKKKAGK